MSTNGHVSPQYSNAYVINDAGDGQPMIRVPEVERQRMVTMQVRVPVFGLEEHVGKTAKSMERLLRLNFGEGVHITDVNL